ncbi:hypothetical protein Tco_0691761 [Tanacetum coccineum]
MARQCPNPKRKRDATWFREKVLSVEAQGNDKVLNEEELEFLADPSIIEDCDEISIAKAVLMANLSSYGSNVLSEVPISDNTNNMLNQSVQEMSYSEPSHFVEHPENEIHSDSNIILYSEYLIESQNAAVQDTNYSAQQDALILSEKNAQFADFKKEINNLKQTLSEQSKEKELLTKTFNVFKNESKEKEAKNIDKEIALEKKVKELDNIICKMGQFAQTVHMLTKPQVFYDNNLKTMPMLYDGNVIAKETNVILIADSEETFMLENNEIGMEVSRDSFAYKEYGMRLMLAPRSARALHEKALLKLHGMRKLPGSPSFGGTLF